jgi:hypothetical protein
MSMDIQIVCDICGYRVPQIHGYKTMCAVRVTETAMQILHWNQVTATLSHLHQKDICDSCVKSIKEMK